MPYFSKKIIWKQKGKCDKIQISNLHNFTHSSPIAPNSHTQLSELFSPIFKTLISLPFLLFPQQPNRG